VQVCSNARMRERAFGFRFNRPWLLVRRILASLRILNAAGERNHTGEDWEARNEKLFTP